MLRAAGKESTQLFKQIHAWVNWNSILQKCKVGHLVPGDDVQFAELDKKEEDRNEDKRSVDVEPTNSPLDDEIFDRNFIVLNETDSLYDLNIEDKKYQLEKPVVKLNEFQTIDNQLRSAYWYETMNEFYLSFKFEKQDVKDEDLMIDVTEERVIKVKIYLLNKVCYSFNCRLPNVVKPEIKFYFEAEALIIILQKLRDELWAGQLHSESYQFELNNQSSLSE